MTAALVAGLAFSSSANAATVAELEAQLAVLLAQLGTTSSVTTSGSFVYGGGLIKVGSRGQQVMDLQKCLAELGNNSSSNIDGIFGTQTKAAVMSFQAANGVTVDGIIGNETGPLYTAACAADMSEDMDEDEDTDSDIPEFGNGEEADVTIEKVKKEDDLDNNKSDQEAFSFEVEADEDGGSARVERVDLQLKAVTAGTGTEDDLWDIIEKVTIEADGDEVASMNTDDDSDWRGDDNTLRLSGLDTIVESDESVEFTVLFDIADLDEEDDLTGSNSISIELEGIEVRYTDEAGITDTVTEGKFDGSGSSTGKTVDIDALDVIEFDVDESNDNPEDETVSLDEDQDDVVAFVQDISVDERDGVLEKVTVNLTFDTAIGGTDSIDELISDATLDFGGDEVDADDIEFGADLNGDGDEDDTVSSVDEDAASRQAVKITFDMDDMDIEVDDEFETTLFLDFEELEDASLFIAREITAQSIIFEGEDETDEDFEVIENVDNGVEIAISAGALKLEESSVDGYNEVGSDDDAAKATFVVEVKADGDEDMQVYAIELDLDGTTVFYGLETQDLYSTAALALAGAAGDVAATNVTNGHTITVKADDDAVTDVVTINDGATEEFEVTVFLSAPAAGEYELELESITWEEDTNGDGDFDDTGADQVAGSLTVSVEADDIDLVASA